MTTSEATNRVERRDEEAAGNDCRSAITSHQAQAIREPLLCVLPEMSTYFTTDSLLHLHPQLQAGL